MFPRVLAWGIVVSGWLLAGTAAAQISAANIPNTITWTTTVSNLRGQNGQAFAFNCPPQGAATSSVWGTDIYTDDSAICPAAVHAGVITFSTGGAVYIEIRPGQASYAGSQRNGVISSNYGGWSGSFVFVTGSGQSQGQLPAPTRIPPPAASDNLALNKPAQQSSTSSWSHQNDPQGAVDGVKNGGFGFHTNGEPNPWWQVDLQSIRTLREVRIFNRLDLPGRAGTIQVLLSNDGVTWQKVYTHDGRPFGGSDGKPLAVALNGAQARFVRLQLGESNYLHLDEVEVYGGEGSVASSTSTGEQALVIAYGKDESDGSDVGWNANYPTPSFDDDPARKGLPNARWQGNHWWDGSKLCMGIKNLEAPYPPAHTLAIGYTVTLNNGTFEDGSTTKTFVLYRYSGTPAQREISQCVMTKMEGGAVMPPRPPEAVQSPASGAVTWETTAASLRGKNGQQFTYACPPNGTPTRLWGTDVYTDDSSICTAAVHSGRILPMTGGTVTIEIRPGQPSYMGTGRNGILSESYPAWTGSFIFFGGSPAAPRPPDATTKPDPLKKEFEESRKKMFKP
jgi:hypothetical protein